MRRKRLHVGKRRIPMPTSVTTNRWCELAQPIASAMMKMLRATLRCLPLVAASVFSFSGASCDVRATGAQETDTRSGFVIPIQRGPRWDRVIVMAKVQNAAPMMFLVDTGAPQTILFSPTFAMNVVQPVPVNLPAARFECVGIQGNAGKFELAGYRWDNFPAIVADVPLISQEGVVGIIGNDVLSNFEVTIDYQRMTMTLRR
jgi:hypothetical protein